MLLSPMGERALACFPLPSNVRKPHRMWQCTMMRPTQKSLLLDSQIKVDGGSANSNHAVNCPDRCPTFTREGTLRTAHVCWEVQKYSAATAYFRETDSIDIFRYTGAIIEHEQVPQHVRMTKMQRKFCSRVLYILGEVRTWISLLVSL